MRNFEKYKQELLAEIAESEVLSAGANHIFDREIGLEYQHVSKCNGIDLYVSGLISESRLDCMGDSWARQHMLYVANELVDLILAPKRGTARLAGPESTKFVSRSTST